MKNAKKATNNVATTPAQILTEIFSQISDNNALIKNASFVPNLKLWLQSLQPSELPKYLDGKKPNIENIREFFAPKQETEDFFDFSDLETTPAPQTKKQREATKQKTEVAKVETIVIGSTPKQETATKKVVETVKQPAPNVKNVSRETVNQETKQTNVKNVSRETSKIDVHGLPILQLGDIVKIWSGENNSTAKLTDCKIIQVGKEPRAYRAEIIGTVNYNGVPYSDKLHSMNVHSIISYSDGSKVPARIFAATPETRRYKNLENTYSSVFSSVPRETVTEPEVPRETKQREATKHGKKSEPKVSRETSNDFISFDDL